MFSFPFCLIIRFFSLSLSWERQLLEDVDRWGLDIFRLADVSNQRPLTAVVYAIFQVSQSGPAGLIILLLVR